MLELKHHESKHPKAHKVDIQLTERLKNLKDHDIPSMNRSAKRVNELGRQTSTHTDDVVVGSSKSLMRKVHNDNNRKQCEILLDIPQDILRRGSFSSNLVTIEETTSHSQPPRKSAKTASKHQEVGNENNSQKQSKTNLAVPRINSKTKPKIKQPESILHSTTTNGQTTGSEHPHDNAIKHVTIVEDDTIHLDEKLSRFGLSSGSSRGRPISSVPSRSYSAASNIQFSCHNPQQELRESNITQNFGNDFKYGDDIVIGGYCGEDPYEERRKDLMDIEKEASNVILTRQENFMERLDKYLEEERLQNQALDNTGSYQAIPEHVVVANRRAAGAKAKAKRLQNMHKRMQRNSVIDAERMARVRENVEDVNKCRYLRIDADQIDLSGIVTLASEQMQMLSGMKFNEGGI